MLSIAIQNTQLPLAVFATSKESSESSSSEYRVWEASGIDVSAASQSNTCTPSLLQKKQQPIVIHEDENVNTSMNFEGDFRKPPKEMISSPRASKVSSSGFATNKSVLPRLSSACELGRYVAYNSSKLSPKYSKCTPLNHDHASPNKTFTHLLSSSE